MFLQGLSDWFPLDRGDRAAHSSFQNVSFTAARIVNRFTVANNRNLNDPLKHLNGGAANRFMNTEIKYTSFFLFFFFYHAWIHTFGILPFLLESIEKVETQQMWCREEEGGGAPERWVVCLLQPYLQITSNIYEVSVFILLELTNVHDNWIKMTWITMQLLLL